MIDITQEQIMQNWNSDIPLVSISCITYNHEPYIAQTLDGFLMQKTDFPFEVLIHDDASTDRTADIIREYEAKFPKLIKPIYQKENQYSKGFTSVSATWNFPRAKGKYIALCEGDDYWIDENKLQIQVDFLENNPEYGMCFHDAVVVNELENEVDSFSYHVIEKDYSATELFENWVVPTASMLFKKEILCYKLADRKNFIAGDIVLVEQACVYGKVHGFKKKMSVYRIQENGLTWSKERREKTLRLHPNHYIALKKNFPLIKKRVINDKIVESYLLCSLKCGTIINKVCWCFQALCISPNAVFRNIIIYLRRKMC